MTRRGALVASATLAATIVLTSAAAAAARIPPTSPVTSLIDPATESGTLSIATVPALPNEPLISIDDGPPLVTDSGGVVRAPGLSRGKHEVTVLVPGETAGRHVRFVRWGDQPDATLTRQISIPDVAALRVGFELDVPVELRYFDPSGRPIAGTLVDAVDIANGRGETISAAGTGTLWLAANRITRPASGLVSDPIDYRIERVLVEGQDVVDRGRQHFAATDGAWDIKVLMFRLEIRARDALFGSAVGSHAMLIHPDGSGQIVDLEPPGFASLINLPRGDYRIALSSEIGLAPQTPIALSKDQTVTVLLVSAVDIALAVGVALCMSIGLVLLGRPTLLRRQRIRRARPAGNPDART